jgi:hypothetical protein
MNSISAKRVLVLQSLLFFLVPLIGFDLLSATNVTMDAKQDWLRQYNDIKKEISRPLAKQSATEASLVADKNLLILPTDRDPLDIVVRRTQALLDNLTKQPHAPDLSKLQLRLNDIKRRITGGGLAKATYDSTIRQNLFLEVCALRRQAVAANPLLNFDQLLFIERGIIATGYHDEINGDHSCDEYFGHNGKAGGGLYILKNPFSGSPEKINILQNSIVQKGFMAGKSLNGGSFITPDLSFDGKRIAFGWSPGGGTKWVKENRFRLFVVNVDGTNLIELTGDVNEDDFDPCWLPGDKRIVFLSTRRGGYGRCHGRPVPTYTLFSMKSDGSDLFCIDWHETNEFHPTINNLGKIVYTRWDYVDRDAVIAHHFWECYLDGRDPRSWRGNYPLPLNTIDPVSGSIGLDLRPNSEFNYMAIPGSSSKYVAIAGPHHGQAFGDIVLVDVSVPDDGKVAQLKKITSGPLYRDDTGDYGTAWPLSEDYFIANYRTGLYVVDKFGNRELIYNCTVNQPGNLDDRFALFRPIDPIPVRPKKLIDGSNFPQLSIQTYQGERASLPEHKPATITILNCGVSDIPTPDIPIKWMRIVQLIPKATPNADDPRTGYATQSLVRMALGVVPVESDGSVYCEAPVGKSIYFQLLDENGMAVRSMRSDTYVHPGEQMVCTGCHEDKWKATPVSPTPIATRRPPSKINPEVIDGSIPFNWHRLVEPILTAKCAPCHKQRGKGPDMSYGSLKDYAFFYEGNQGNFTNAIVGGSRVNPGKFGARLAKLTSHLDSTHYGVKLTSDERRRITLWLDLNSNELGAYTRVSDQQAGKIVWPELDIDILNPLGVEDPTSDSKAVAVRIDPGFAAIKPGNVCQFTSIAVDSLNRKVIPQPSFSWSVSGGGSITSSGLFTAGSNEGGPYTVSSKAVINGTEQTFSSVVLVSSLSGIPLPGGYINRMLCLTDNAGSTCLQARDTATITSKYTGSGNTPPVDGASIQINGSTRTWVDQTNGSGSWFTGCGDNTTAYGFINIVNYAARTLRLGYIQDDEITVWMNGTRLFSDKSWASTERLSPTFTLPSGNNSFLIKFSNGSGNSSLSLRFADNSGADIKDLLFYTDPKQTSGMSDIVLKPFASIPYTIRSAGGILRIDGVCTKGHRVEIFKANGQRLFLKRGVGDVRYSFSKECFGESILIVRLILDGKMYVKTVSVTRR